MKTLTLLWLAFSAVLTPARFEKGAGETATRVEAACPPEHKNARVRVGNLLGSPLFPEIRVRFDLGTASLEEIRLLSNATDRETCVRLWEALENTGTVLTPADAATFYQSGDRYFVPVARRGSVPEGVVRLDGSSSLQVYDSSFRLVGRFRA